MKNEVKVFNTTGSFKSWECVVKKTALFVLKCMNIENSSLEIFFLADEEIKNINKKYRKKNKATTILSFSYLKSKILIPSLKQKRFIGEIFLAPAFIKRKKDDIIRLTIHGVLHILGYTHSNKKSSIIMERKEREIFLKLQKNVKNYKCS